MQTANCASSSSTLAWCLSGGFSKSPIRQIFLFQKLKTLQLKSGSTLYGNKTAVFTICSARRRRPSFDVSHRNCRLCHTFLYQPFRVSLHQINRLNLLMTHQTYHQTKKMRFLFLAGDIEIPSLKHQANSTYIIHAHRRRRTTTNEFPVARQRTSSSALITIFSFFHFHFCRVEHLRNCCEECKQTKK